MSTRDDIAALHSAGVSYRQIGQAVGRNDSLIGQIARGVKPGHNLRDAVAELRARLDAGVPVMAAPVAAPIARRRQSVRRKIRRGGDRWAVATAKRQATRSGARDLAGLIYDAESKGDPVSLNVAVRPGIEIGKSKVRKHGGGEQQVRAGAAGAGLSASALADLVDAHGGDVTAAVAEFLELNGYAASIGPEDIGAVEVSTWAR